MVLVVTLSLCASSQPSRPFTCNATLRGIRDATLVVRYGSCFVPNGDWRDCTCPGSPNSCAEHLHPGVLRSGNVQLLNIQNNCSQSLTIVFVAKDGPGTSGTMDLRPGGQDSVGKLGGRLPKVGGFQIYVCRSGYIPVGEDGKVVKKPRANFQCQPKPE